MASNNRMERINSEIQKEISLIINNEINDPRVTGFISVLKVSLSIFADDKQSVFDAITSAGSFIRKKLSVAVKLREIPKLIFELDDGIEYSNKINKIINSLDIKPLEDEEWFR